MKTVWRPNLHLKDFVSQWSARKSQHLIRGIVALRYFTFIICFPVMEVWSHWTFEVAAALCSQTSVENSARSCLFLHFGVGVGAGRESARCRCVLAGGNSPIRRSTWMKWVYVDLWPVFSHQTEALVVMALYEWRWVDFFFFKRVVTTYSFMFVCFLNVDEFEWTGSELNMNLWAGTFNDRMEWDVSWSGNVTKKTPKQRVPPNQTDIYARGGNLYKRTTHNWLWSINSIHGYNIQHL